MMKLYVQVDVAVNTLWKPLLCSSKFVSRWHAFFNYGSIRKILEPSAKQRHGRFINQLHIGNLLNNSSSDFHPTDGNVCKTYCFTTKEPLPFQSALQSLQILSSFFCSFVLLLRHLRECAHDCWHAPKANRMSNAILPFPTGYFQRADSSSTEAIVLGAEKLKQRSLG
ncbi:hypothetical protein RJ639_019498 [Escallonia herrerae]|uniref:FHA domain-containing protein n=1 Tax=Escallonia herrerae TaxID=1293975 RepID=A0AA88V8E3_9ASTE|nr:hypothetical protein RJ639_019498 [Escallonia herrerae]